MTETVTGIEYKKPQVTLLHVTPLINAELAGRTAYQSFDKSEHETVRTWNGEPLQDVEHSKIMDTLCHVYHHDSVMEHINLTYNVTTSRGVLIEHSRHRIQSLTVQSTRYTMSSVINAFIASSGKRYSFELLIKKLDMFIVSKEAEELEVKQLFDKLMLQIESIGMDEFLKISLSKDNIKYVESDKFKDDNLETRFNTLQSNKQKRNVGDNFKWIVTDNWKVDMIVTMNLRALSNYLKLRDSGAAYFGIRWLSAEIIKATPRKYLDLIMKQDAINKHLN